MSVHLVGLKKKSLEGFCIWKVINENLIKKMCLKGIKKRDGAVSCIGLNHVQVNCAQKWIAADWYWIVNNNNKNKNVLAAG